MVLVFSDYVRRKHYSGWLSRAMLVQVVLWAFLIIFPFFVGFTTNNFWIREGTYSEQPRLTFKHQYMLVAHGPPSTTPLLFFSSFDAINQLFPGALRVPEISVVMNDSNSDSRPEYWRITVSLPLQSTEQIHQVELLLLFDVALQDRSRVLLEGAAYVEYASPLAGSALYTDGDLVLRMLNALPAATVRNVAAPSVINTADIVSQADVSLPKILAAYGARNESTRYEAPHRVWVPGGGGGGVFTVQATVRAPSQPIRYKPNFLETVKMAWVQYLALFWATWFFVSIVRGFIFREQIVPTKVVWEQRLKET